MMDSALACYDSLASEFPPLDRAEEMELTCALRTGTGDVNAVTRRLVEPNLRLVFDLVTHCGDCGVSPFDLLQAGNTALLNSIETYRRASSGTSFATHAMPRIVTALSAMIERK